MLPHTPITISIAFSIVAIITLLLFYKATPSSKDTFKILLVWMLLQGGVSLSGFYTHTEAVPPRFIFLILLPLLLIGALFISAIGRSYLDSLDAKRLTLLHTIRIPVEIILFALASYKTIPDLMTFEGRNWDIFSGLTAPIIYYFGYIKQKLSSTFILLWNFVCLGLLLNIVINAILSAPFKFQQFAFDQPNIAVLHFPFVWLPCLIVPLVLLAHLACIRKLIKKTS